MPFFNDRAPNRPTGAPQSMRSRVPDLAQYLSDCGVTLVRLEYWGGEERGCAEVIFLSRADGSPYHIRNPERWMQLKAAFVAILKARQPDWADGNGSAGDFRWDIKADSVQHSHYTLGESGNPRVTYHGVEEIFYDRAL